MQQPNRNYTSSSYRYGFQGQEKDDELKGEGNSIDYKYRMHDPRVGRFFAVDPLTKEYPHYTPYSFSGNKVIHAIELEGLEELVLTEKFIEWFEPVHLVIHESKILTDYVNSISLESKKDKQIVYLTTFVGSKKTPDGFTTTLNSRVKLHTQLTKRKQQGLNARRPFTTSDERKLRGLNTFFQDKNLSIEDLKREDKLGKELVLITVNENAPKYRSLQEQVMTIIHEIVAPDHAKDMLEGKEVENIFDGHIEYFDLNKYPSGLTEHQIKSGYSPKDEDIHPNSKAGKDKKEIENAIKKFEKKKKQKEKRKEKKG